MKITTLLKAIEYWNKMELHKDLILCQELNFRAIAKIKTSAIFEESCFFGLALKVLAFVGMITIRVDKIHGSKGAHWIRSLWEEKMLWRPVMLKQIFYRKKSTCQEPQLFNSKWAYIKEILITLKWIVKNEKY